MKKSLLLLCALFAGAFAMNAQTEGDPTPFHFGEAKPQAIPGWMSLGDSYRTVWKAADAESDPKDIYTEHDAKAEFNGVSEAPTLNSNHNGDIIDFNVVSEVASYYVVTFHVGSKNDGSSADLQILDGENPIWTGSINFPNTGSWSSRSWAAPYAIVDTEIPAGSYTFRITLKQEDPKANVVNIAGINFEANADVPQQCSIWAATQLDNIFEDTDEPGKVVISPDMEYYISGTELTVNAQANTGYKFLYYYLNNDTDNKVYDNPYVFNIVEDTDIAAVFEEVNMYNAVPGTINLETKGDYATNNGSKLPIQHGNIKTDGEAVTGVDYIGNMRTGGWIQFKLDVKAADTYVINFFGATKNEPGTTNIAFSIVDEDDSSVKVEPAAVAIDDKRGGWTDMLAYKTEEFALTPGKKIMTITFTGTKDTVNMYGITFTGKNSSGIEDVVVSEENGEIKAYNLQGIEVAPDTKGLIIINGKKVYNK